MFELNEETIKKLSRLSRIEIPDSEIAAFHRTLKQVVDYFGQLNEVNLDDLSPYSHVEEQGVGSLREDVTGELLSRESFLANAPDHVGGMIRTPPVLKQHP